ncbi:transcription initiation factor TFIID subunit 9-like [Rhodamnia argentea]|uniref:Transcription initiation factor TFIID subunit 9-like n=1 Tax=Rhodamnia argentea TaxID=178133 RepID=A0ABM3HUK1_9MYRT|nr:transcription initiation factor TFIID subunit 9-like [Rhodamnia argentea]
MAEKDEDFQIRRDAKIIKYLLPSIGIEEYEPCVVDRMLELWYKYAGDALTQHAGKGKVLIDSDDIKACDSVKGQRHLLITSSSPRRLICLEASLARAGKKQKQDSITPRTVAGPGTLLPSEQTLISPNYQLAIPEKQSLEEAEQDEVAKLNPSLEQSTELEEEMEMNDSWEE